MPLTMLPVQLIASKNSTYYVDNEIGGQRTVLTRAELELDSIFLPLWKYKKGMPHTVDNLIPFKWVGVRSKEFKLITQMACQIHFNLSPSGYNTCYHRAELITAASLVFSELQVLKRNMLEKQYD